MELKEAEAPDGCECAGMTDADRMKLVVYITDSSLWKDFKVYQKKHWVKVNLLRALHIRLISDLTRASVIHRGFRRKIQRTDFTELLE